MIGGLPARASRTGLVWSGQATVPTLLLAVLLALTLPVSAMDLSRLDFPEGTVATGSRTDPQSRYALPAAVFDGQSVPMTPIIGQRVMQGWSAPLPAAGSVFPLFDGLAAQVAAQGYAIDLRCSVHDCGGFDFRQAIDLLPPPGMFLDMSDFYALRATRTGGQGAQWVFLTVSRTDQRATVQITMIGAAAESSPAQPTDTGVPSLSETAAAGASGDTAKGPAVSDMPPVTLAAELDRSGKAVLADVIFSSGGSTLDAIPASLPALAAYLRERPDQRAVIVGHSDSKGGAAANMALSRRRAEAVRQVLVRDLGVPSDQVTSDGVGPLAPLDTNATEDGRARNRRVEVVLLSP